MIYRTCLHHRMETARPGNALDRRRVAVACLKVSAAKALGVTAAASIPSCTVPILAAVITIASPCLTDADQKHHRRNSRLRQIHIRVTSGVVRRPYWSQMSCANHPFCSTPQWLVAALTHRFECGAGLNRLILEHLEERRRLCKQCWRGSTKI